MPLKRSGRVADGMNDACSDQTSEAGVTVEAAGGLAPLSASAA